MRKRELKKWESKFKVWRALHPYKSRQFWQYGINRCEKYCPLFKECCGNKHRLVVDIITGKVEVLISTLESTKECIEWIKYA